MFDPITWHWWHWELSMSWRGWPLEMIPLHGRVIGAVNRLHGKIGAKSVDGRQVKMTMSIKAEILPSKFAHHSRPLYLPDLLLEIPLPVPTNLLVNLKFIPSDKKPHSVSRYRSA